MSGGRLEWMVRSGRMMIELMMGRSMKPMKKKQKDKKMMKW